MKLVPYDVNKLRNRSFEACRNQRIIQQFLDSGETCVKLEDFPHKSANVCRSVMRASIQRMKLDSTVKAVLRNGEVFLIRLDVK